MQLDSPTQFLNSVFDNLPHEARDMHAGRGRTLYGRRKREFVGALKERAWLSSLRLGCLLILRNPLRVIVDSIGKLTRPLQLVSILGTLCLVV